MWLGITGVGSLVLISLYLLVSGLPLKWLPSDQVWSGNDVFALVAVNLVLIGLMLPLDLLGGFLLPNRSRPNTLTASTFWSSWVRGVLVQSACFLAASLAILACGRLFGLFGALACVTAIAVALVTLQLRLAKLIASLPSEERESEASPGDGTLLADALDQTTQWGFPPRPILVLNHHDTGFTGGVVGLPGRETVVLPATSLDKLNPQQLAVTIARRLEAIKSGSRTRGMLVAFVWVIAGFALSAMLPGAGVTSVGQIVMTCVGFTLWTFLGLLTLPTLSRQASYAIDRRVVDQGASAETLNEMVSALDRLQDDEPKRSALIEAIFHPVPSVENRQGEFSNASPIAWHAARMTLFISWACMGMLVRAVHCNAGRPELWVMLPTD